MRKILFVSFLLWPSSLFAISALPLFEDAGCLGDPTAIVLLRDSGEGAIRCNFRTIGTYLWGRAVKIDGICIRFSRFASGSSEVCQEVNKIFQ